jgi:hypothetical protein
MLNETEWVALGVAATLVCAWVAQRIGWLQISFMKKEHALNIIKAAPKVGTSVWFKEREHPGQPGKLLFICTSIYNEGDLAASNLKGNWKLSCSDKRFDVAIPISRDHLGNSRPFDFERQLGGIHMPGTVQQSQNFAIEIDIEFSYFGLEEDGEKPYHAKYSYNKNQKQFVRVED